ncbi:hypothetical protein [Streptomyces sp. NPDC059003]|uniref:hypothetical protein n=1 Tax=Streptomyces sp. NPDC059003 TaxID=3346691 RepID=UPI0036B1BC8B
MGSVNLINVLAHEHDIDARPAWQRALALHDRELAEFVRLQSTLPDFGDLHDAVANHVHHLSFVILGWRGVDAYIQSYDRDSYACDNQR